MNARLIIAALLIGSANMSFAVSACTGNAGNGTEVTASSNFVQANFTPTCSNNVQLNWEQDTNQVGVCANSKKGKTDFSGNTNGVAPTAKTGVCTGESGKCTPPTANKDGCA